MYATKGSEGAPNYIFKDCSSFIGYARYWPKIARHQTKSHDMPRHYFEKPNVMEWTPTS
jgi:hypothetical protein